MADILDGARVLVTGASSGIGLEIARQAAPRAREVILVARRADLLAGLAAELTERHPHLTVTQQPCDLLDEGARDRLADEVLAGGAIDVLVNNAGIGYEELIDRAEWDRVRAMLEVNVAAVTHLTVRLLPAMVAQGSGALLFVGSGAGHVFMPRSSVYAATKHYVAGFVESLRIDLRGTGVTATQVAPGPVDTEFDAIAALGSDGMAGHPPGNVGISAAQCAQESLAALRRGRPLVFPGRSYRALMRTVLLLPLPARRAIFARPGRVEPS